MGKLNVFLLCVALALGLGVGYWFANDAVDGDHIAMSTQSQPEQEPLFYRNPMNPEITSPVPAQDDMGMDYVPVYADEMGGADLVPGTVSIDPVTLQNMGVRTAMVERRSIAHIVRAPGRVDYDEKRLSMVHPRVEGWVETLYVERVGDQIDADTPLLEIYSPQLVTSQQEYLLALNNLDAQRKNTHPDIRNGAERLATSARSRLEFLDVPEHQIRELERTRAVKNALHIHSPAGGVVLAINVREGQFVNPGTPLFKIADLSKVWVIADIYEYEMPWVDVGAKASMNVESLPGQVFKGTVSYIYPYLEPRTRTVKVRMEFDNPDLALKPDTYATVKLESVQSLEAAVVPSEAVIRSGTRNALFVVKSEGQFEPRVVTLGVVADGLIQILDGVEPGEEVITSGQFLIDSESNLREALSRMMSDGEVADD
ncbi:MAG: efflux RND transporter periplasmic adaptor subunit [Rhodospirillaceae bacterium]